MPPASRSWGAGGFLYPGKSARHLVPSNTFPGTWAGLSPIAVSSELIAGSDAVSPTMTYPFGAGSGSVKLLPSIVASMVSPGRASPPRGHPVVHCELGVDGVGLRIGVDQGVPALMQLVAVGEPHPDPHRRVQRPIGQQAARLEAQPQVVRAELATAGHGQLVLACAQAA